jgi:hypothetical protein
MYAEIVRGTGMSEKREEMFNVVTFAKVQERQKTKQTPKEENKVTDEEFKMFLNALLGPYKGGGYNPE